MGPIYDVMIVQPINMGIKINDYQQMWISMDRFKGSWNFSGWTHGCVDKTP